MAVDDIDSARRLLYGEANETFVAARNALAKQVRSDGKRELANVIAALRKPSSIAAEVNRIAREDPSGVELILQAAELLRTAQTEALDGAGVDASALQQQYRAAISAIAQRAEHKPAEVRAALEAATIVEASNEALRSGCLVTIPTPETIFGVGPSSATSADTAPSPPDELAARRAKKRAAVQEGEREVASRKADEAARAERERAAERERQIAALAIEVNEASAAHERAIDEQSVAAAAASEAAAVLSRAQSEAAAASENQRRLEAELAAAAERSEQLTITLRQAEVDDAAAAKRAEVADSAASAVAATLAQLLERQAELEADTDSSAIRSD